ncbi:MAG: response regulator transcription factor [Reyranella sp.]|nr:response regulator transcription factor [Reyranella sp.]
MDVLIIDGHPLVHEVMGNLVRSVFGDVKLRTALNLEDAAATMRNNVKLDLALLDLALPECVGIEALTQFRGICPTVPVLVVSADDSRGTILAAMKAGAIGYLPKTLTPKVMGAAINLVRAGGFYVPYEALGHERLVARGTAAGGPASRPRLGLTDRQREVLQLIQKGYNNRKIARQLEISESTVKQHLHTMFGTLRVSSRTEAIAAAQRLGFRHE